MILRTGRISHALLASVPDLHSYQIHSSSKRQTRANPGTHSTIGIQIGSTARSIVYFDVTRRHAISSESWAAQAYTWRAWKRDIEST
ncbi:hypothetical protein SGLAU_33350 (plasmid) [Streptomyces glaucescens]|uniref:Uncharacterized protein n=1 Tax=Streptomyces glaucescens TaxID=1907 RepID=A0A089XF37_STRGA|nr:hypothetical protein SGLAU_33350 [Streptomyces glaucescens]